MPQTEQCVLGAENRTNIENVKDEMDEFKADMRRYMERMDKNIDKLTNHYSKRAPWSVVLLVSTLSSALVGTVMWIITH